MVENMSRRKPPSSAMTRHAVSTWSTSQRAMMVVRQISQASKPLLQSIRDGDVRKWLATWKPDKWLMSSCGVLA